MIDRTKITHINDVMYMIIRVINEDDTNTYTVDEWKKITFTDKVFRKDGLLYFCKTIDDAQIINENDNVLIKKDL